MGLKKHIIGDLSNYARDRLVDLLWNEKNDPTLASIAARELSRTGYGNEALRRRLLGPSDEVVAAISIHCDDVEVDEEIANRLFDVWRNGYGGDLYEGLLIDWAHTLPIDELIGLADTPEGLRVLAHTRNPNALPVVIEKLRSEQHSWLGDEVEGAIDLGPEAPKAVYEVYTELKDKIEGHLNFAYIKAFSKKAIQSQWAAKGLLLLVDHPDISIRQSACGEAVDKGIYRVDILKRLAGEE